MQLASTPATYRGRESAQRDPVATREPEATAARDKREFEREVARARRRLGGAGDGEEQAEAVLERSSGTEANATSGEAPTTGLLQLALPGAPVTRANTDANTPSAASPTTALPSATPSLPNAQLEPALDLTELVAARESVHAAPTTALGEARATHGLASQPLTTAHEPEALPAQPAHAAELAEQRAADILRQVRVQLVAGSREAHVRLDPPELGAIAIRLVVHEGRVDAELRVEERATLDLLTKHIPELRATLARAGMHAGAFDLQLGLGEQRQGDTSRQRGARSSPTAAIEAPRELRAALTASLGRDAAVDTYA